MYWSIIVSQGNPNEYFDSKTLLNDETIDFSLGYSSFLDNYPSKLISVIWEGYLKPDSSEIYTITFEVQGRIIVYIDNKLEISYLDSKNSKTSSSYTQNFVNIALDSSTNTPIKYYTSKKKMF